MTIRNQLNADSYTASQNIPILIITELNSSIFLEQFCRIFAKMFYTEAHRKWNSHR